MSATDFMRLDSRGRLGLALLAGSLGLWLLALQPAIEARSGLRAERERLTRAAPPVAGQRAEVVARASAAELPGLLRDVQRLADEEGVAILRADYTVRATPADSGWRELEMSVPAEGRYPALRRFLRRAQALGPGVRVEALEIEREQATQEALAMQLRLLLLFSTATPGAQGGGA